MITITIPLTTEKIFKLSVTDFICFFGGFDALGAPAGVQILAKEICGGVGEFSAWKSCAFLNNVIFFPTYDHGSFTSGQYIQNEVNDLIVSAFSGNLLAPLLLRASRTILKSEYREVAASTTPVSFFTVSSFTVLDSFFVNYAIQSMATTTGTLWPKLNYHRIGSFLGREDFDFKKFYFVGNVPQPLPCPATVLLSGTTVQLTVRDRCFLQIWVKPKRALVLESDLDDFLE